MAPWTQSGSSHVLSGPARAAATIKWKRDDVVISMERTHDAPEV